MKKRLQYKKIKYKSYKKLLLGFIKNNYKKNYLKQ